MVGDRLPCSCIVVCNHLEPGGEAHQIIGQGNLAVPSFLVLGGVW